MLAIGSLLGPYETGPTLTVRSGARVSALLIAALAPLGRKSARRGCNP
ncbi:hypothetical protein [Streptomyces sp. WM6386]|nr:hypothetical protein [Streptomyces sp. WM6386]